MNIKERQLSDLLPTCENKVLLESVISKWFFYKVPWLYTKKSSLKVEVNIDKQNKSFYQRGNNCLSFNFTFFSSFLYHKTTTTWMHDSNISNGLISSTRSQPMYICVYAYLFYIELYNHSICISCNVIIIIKGLCVNIKRIFHLP